MSVVAKPNPAEVGQSFFERVLANIPEEQRGLLTPAVVEVLAPVVGAGVMRQDDYSREMDRLTAVEREQNAWWAANKAAADLGRKASEAGFDPAKPSPTTALPDNVVTAELLEQRERSYASVAALIPALMFKHQHVFGELLDVTSLMADPNVGKLGLQGVYDQKFAARYAEKAQADEKARVDKAVEEGIRERMKTMRHPGYPSSESVDTSPLAALKPVDDKGANVDDLVAAYYEEANRTPNAP